MAIIHPDFVRVTRSFFRLSSFTHSNQHLCVQIVNWCWCTAHTLQQVRASREQFSLRRNPECDRANSSRQAWRVHSSDWSGLHVAGARGVCLSATPPNWGSLITSHIWFVTLPSNSPPLYCTKCVRTMSRGMRGTPAQQARALKTASGFWFETLHWPVFLPKASQTQNCYMNT